MAEKIRRSYQRGQFHLTEEQIKLLVKHTKKPRDKIILRLMAYCGLRRFEVAKIRIRDINLQTRKILVLGKKNIEKISTIVSDKLLDDLALYIGWLSEKGKVDYLFPAVSSLNQLGHISITEINRIVARAGRNANIKNPTPGLKNINPHILRHSCARILKDKGLSLEVIQKVLGHLSFKSTMDVYGTKSIYEMDKELKEKIGELFE